MKVIKFSKVVFFSACITATKALPSLGPTHTVYSGNYKIQECGSLSPKVDALLQQTFTFLQPLISNPTINQPAYQAFFGGVPPDPVQRVYSQIATGANLTFEGFSPSTPLQTQPQIFCVSPSRRNDLAECGKKSLLFYKNAVGLCPDFFAWTLRGGGCGSTNAAKTSMVSTPPDGQYGAMVYGLAHMYLKQIYETPDAESVIVPINDCINAKPGVKVKSAANYYFYALSVLENCTDFPKGPVSPPDSDRDRELLAAEHGSEFVVMAGLYEDVA